MKSVTFTGTVFEVQRKAAEWKAANPTVRVVNDGAPVAAGEKTLLVDEPVWALTLRYEDSN